LRFLCHSSAPGRKAAVFSIVRREDYLVVVDLEFFERTEHMPNVVVTFHRLVVVVPDARLANEL
jgi:hypothetical protein